MARRRPQPETGSIWSRGSGPPIPFFAACVVALTLWQAEASSEASEDATIAGLTSPVSADLSND